MTIVLLQILAFATLLIFGVCTSVTVIAMAICPEPDDTRGSYDVES